jgi:CRISPR-associated protein Cas1
VLRRINEAVAGWRRYYGLVVRELDLAPLEAQMFDAIVAVLVRERTNGRLRKPGEARDLLAHIELLCRRDQQARNALREELIDRAFKSTVPDCTRRAQPVRGSRPGALPPNGRPPAAARPLQAEGSTAPSPAAPGPSGARASRRSHAQAGGAVERGDVRRRPRSVAAAVRQRKRSQLRFLGNVSELVVATPGSFVGKTSQRLIVRCERRVVCEAPVDRLTSVTIATTGAAISADAIALCATQRVPVLLVSPRGETVAMLTGPAWSDGQTALAQLNALAAGAPAFDLATRFVRGKIRAQMNMIKYLGKHRRRANAQFDAVCREALDGIGRLLAELRRLRPVADYEASRGHLFSIEGRGAGHYWRVVREVLAPRVAFNGRERQGATDLVNSMLNYGYAVLQARVYQAVVRAGLNPHVSFLHALQPGKPTLVFDLMEEFRPQAVDRVVIALLARRQPVAVDANGMLSDASRRLLLEALYRRLASLICHRGRERTLQEVIDEQARAVAKHLRHERAYRPFACKW